MKNLDLINKRSGSREKNRDHGRIGCTNRNNLPKERTIYSFFLPRNVLNCQTSVFFSCLFLSVYCVCWNPESNKGPWNMEGHDRQRYKAWHRMMMMMIVCVCCFLVFSLRPAHSWLSFLTLDMVNPDKIKIWSIYVCFCRSCTGLKVTKIRLDIVEKSRDQVKIEAQMMHWVATQTGSLEIIINQNLDLEINIES